MPSACPHIVVTGAGPAGVFASLTLRELLPDARLTLLEIAPEPLLSLRHWQPPLLTRAEYDPATLAEGYPGSEREFIGPLHHFQPADAMDWFEHRGLPLRERADGVVEPAPNAPPLREFFLTQLRKADITLRYELGLLEITPRSTGGFLLSLTDDSSIDCEGLLLATGADNRGRGLTIAGQLGHEIRRAQPSRFTFKVKDNELRGLSGLTLSETSMRLTLVGKDGKPPPPEAAQPVTGPLEIAQWGLAGGAVLDMAARYARLLQEAAYTFTVEVDLLSGQAHAALHRFVQQAARLHPRQRIHAAAPPEIPEKLWARLAAHAGIAADTVWQNLGKREYLALSEKLKRLRFEVTGRRNDRTEPTCGGGIALAEIDCPRMESRLHPGICFAGEMLDLRACPGGYPAQALWTSAALAARTLANL